jgi:hypothetical protein
MALFVRRPDMQTLPAVKGIYYRKNSIKSSDSFDSYTFTDRRISVKFSLGFLLLFDRNSLPIPRQFYTFTNGKISVKFSAGFLPLFEQNQSPILRWSSHILVVRAKRPETKRNLFRHQGRFYVIYYLLLKRIWRIYRLH